MIVRELTNDDLDVLIEIEKSLYKDPWNKEAYLRDLENDIAYNYVLVHDDVILGYYGFWIMFDNIDIEGVGLVTILRKNVLNIMSIQMNAKATPESTGMTPKQFNAVRYSCGKIKDDKLIEMLQFLNSIDYRLKSGNLTLSNSRMIDYILCNVL